MRQLLREIYAQLHSAGLDGRLYSHYVSPSHRLNETMGYTLLLTEWRCGIFRAEIGL